MIFSNIFSNITSTNLIFGQFSVARKLILNAGAIRPTGLLSIFRIKTYSIICYYYTISQLKHTFINSSI